MSDKLFDRLLKSLAVDDPRALYHLLSEPLPPEDAEIKPMIQEIVIKLSQLDYWCVFQAGERERADVFEFKGKYESTMQHQLLRYAMATSVATDLAVRATVIVVSGKKFPKAYRELDPIECAGVRMEFQTVRLWEIDAKLALDFERSSLLSLVPFMKHTWAQLAEALRRLRRAAKEALDIFWHAFLLRYSREEAEQLRLEVGMNSAIMERLWNELLPDSPWAEGIRHEGELQGELREARQSVGRILRHRFPDVEATGLEAVLDLGAIHDAFDQLLEAPSAAEARAIIENLTRR